MKDKDKTICKNCGKPKENWHSKIDGSCHRTLSSVFEPSTTEPLNEHSIYDSPILRKDMSRTPRTYVPPFNSSSQVVGKDEFESILENRIRGFKTMGNSQTVIDKLTTCELILENYRDFKSSLRKDDGQTTMMPRTDSALNKQMTGNVTVTTPSVGASSQTAEEMRNKIAEIMYSARNRHTGHTDVAAETWEKEADYLLEQIMPSLRAQILAEFADEVLVPFMKEEFGINDKEIPIDTTHKEHGSCCYCQECGHDNDNCVCLNNRFWKMMKAHMEGR